MKDPTIRNRSRNRSRSRAANAFRLAHLALALRARWDI